MPVSETFARSQRDLGAHRELHDGPRVEGVGEVISEIAKDASARKFLWRFGLTMLSSGLQQIQQALDWEQYGGAPILGFAQPIIKAHGRSRSRAIGNACKVAVKAARSDMTRVIERAVAKMPAVEESGF